MICIIFNPTSKKGESRIVLKKTIEYLSHRSINYSIYETEYSKHAYTLASELSRSYKELIIIGGDGTVFEVLNGSSDNNIVYSVIPAGTGNDIARMLDIPEKTDLALDIALNRKIKCIDYGLINNQYKTILFSSFGIVIKVISRARSKVKKSKLSYYKSLLRESYSYSPQKYLINQQGYSQEYYADFISIQNAKCSGGGMCLSESAIIDDGEMNLVIIEYKNKIRRFLNIIAMLRGRLSNQPNVITFPVKEISIYPQSGKELCCIDGELIELSHLELNIEHKGIRFIC